MPSIRHNFPLIVQTLSALAAAATIACSSSHAPTTTTPGPTDSGPAAVDAAPWLTYPEGPYGLKAGDVFPNLTFKGYKDGTGNWTDISMIDYYDPDGTLGIYGVYFVVGAQWCGPCGTEADMLPDFWTKQYRPRGARFLTAIIQDLKGKPATQLTVDQWIAAHGINFDIALDDTSDSLPTSGRVGLPHNYLINPRNMKVIRVIEGIVPTDTTIGPLNTLLKSNGAPKLDAGI